MADPFEELKNLPPEERIKKLKEIEEKNKKEIQQAEAMLKESEAQLEDEQDQREKIPIPQLKAVDVDALFGGEEKQLFEMKRFVKAGKPGLEEKEKPRREREVLEDIAREAPVLTEEQLAAQTEYFQKQDTKELYATVKGIYNEVKAQARDMTDEEKAATYQISRELERREEMIETGTYKGTGENIQDMLNIGKNIIKTLYRR